MFTGIVAKVRVARWREKGRLTLELGSLARTLKVGGSLSVNGVCLTAAEKTSMAASFDLSEETLRRTALGLLRAGQWVNVEPPLRMGQALGGHVVQGHVDGVGFVLETAPSDRGSMMRIAVGKEIRRWLVPRGSVAVEGASLTVSSIARVARRDVTLLRYFDEVLVKCEAPKPDVRPISLFDTFTVHLVAHTLKASVLGDRRCGDPVNIEADILLKWLSQLGKRDRTVSSS